MRTYRVRAVAYVGHEMIAEQANREGVLQHAIEDLRSAPPEEDPGSEIDDDWLHAFIKEASTKSAPDMQLLFGKILSGEIKRPGTFSLRAVRTLSMMSQTTAKQFEKFCNLSIAAANFVMVIALKAQLKYELDFETLSNLNENDLIYGDFNIPLDFAPLLVPRMGRPAETDPFEYAGETVWLHATDVTKIDALRQVNSAMFSRTGIELRRIVSMQPDPSYTLELIEYFDTRGCDLMKATGRNEDGHLIGRRYRDTSGAPPSPHRLTPASPAADRATPPAYVGLLGQALLAYPFRDVVRQAPIIHHRLQGRADDDPRVRFLKLVQPSSRMIVVTKPGGGATTPSRRRGKGRSGP